MTLGFLIKDWKWSILNLPFLLFCRWCKMWTFKVSRAGYFSSSPSLCKSTIKASGTPSAPWVRGGGKGGSCWIVLPLGAAEDEMGNRPVVVLSQSTADFQKAVLQIILTFDLERTIYFDTILDSFLPALNLLFYFGQQFFGKMQLSSTNCFSQLSLSLYQKIQGDLFDL